jgi:hypothetical protein
MGGKMPGSAQVAHTAFRREQGALLQYIFLSGHQIHSAHDQGNADIFYPDILD